MGQTLIRQNQIVNDGWIPAGETWTYASASTITVPSGAASKYQKGDKIKLTQTTAKYFYVVGVADTVLTVTGGTDYTVANATITSPFYSKVETPQGFPQWFNYTPTVTAGTGTFTSVSASGLFNLVGDMCHNTITISVTTNGTASSYTLATLPLTADTSDTFIYAGREFDVNGLMLYGFVSAVRPTQVFVRDYKNVYNGGDGANLVVSGWYRIS